MAHDVSDAAFGMQCRTRHSVPYQIDDHTVVCFNDILCNAGDFGLHLLNAPVLQATAGHSIMISMPLIVVYKQK